MVDKIVSDEFLSIDYLIAERDGLHNQVQQSRIRVLVILLVSTFMVTVWTNMFLGMGPLYVAGRFVIGLPAIPAILN